MTLVAEAQAELVDDSPAMNEIVRRFERLASKIAGSLTDCPHLREDLANAALMAVVKATRRHTPGVNGFVTFTTRYMTGAALRERKSWMAQAKRDDIAIDDAELDLPPAPTVEDAADLGSPWDATHEAVSSLTERQRSLLTRRYVVDLDLAAIAAMEGTSVSAVSQRLHTVHKAIALNMAA